ncbi:MAG: hypothetical protein AMS23_10575 [Bacteroides sp. SM1_62]|nr:MAG: hypothetical protein AMS26_05945 [Bacteroides sp. SM23_62]KPL20672.1 MAG: hypothetical protein AMS23_10575 [Bacteroides sp. SM1_62]
MSNPIATIIAFMVLILVPGLTDLAVFASQDESKIYPDFSFSCTQNNQQFILKTRLSYWTGERDVPISGSVITCYLMAGEESRQLEAVRTDMDGDAVFRIDKKSERLESAGDIYTFRAVFEGSREFEMTEDIAAVKPLNMNLEFVEIDSIKTIMAEAFETDPEGNPVPLEDTDVYFYVPRSFSLLPVGEEWFMGGTAQVDFPTSLPGDSAGNLTIVARIQDHELYGNVEAVAVKDWGLAVPRVIVEKRRGLGDTDAPLWMVYTLIVLLSIVWFHYLYVFYVMIKIKKLRRN